MFAQQQSRLLVTCAVIAVFVGMLQMYANHAKKTGPSGKAPWWATTERFREGADAFGEAEGAVRPRDEQETTYKPVDFDSAPMTTPADASRSMACFPKDKITAEDLLPKDAANTKWAQLNPTGTGALQNVNFLTAGYNMGVNTIGSSHKNPNMTIRADPYIPKEDVSPWLQSTIDHDPWRKKLD